MKNLYRSNQNSVIGGVAGGIGEYFNIDPVIIRVLFFVTVFSGGIGVLIYLVMWVIVPSQPFVNEEEYNRERAKEQSYEYAGPGGESFTDYDDYENYNPNQNKSENGSLKVFFGIALLLFGLIMLIDKFLPYSSIEYIVPIGLVFLGTYIIFSSRKDKE